MALKRMVIGQVDEKGKVIEPYEVDLTPEEEATVRAEWEQNAPAPSRRRVPKQLIIARLNDAGKLDAANAALEADVYAKARWYTPGQDTVFADDPDTVTMLAAIGADPDTILAP
jgi:hypothetical protein